MMLSFGPYRPDVAQSNPGISRRVVNVSPRKDASGISYHPRRSFQMPGSGSPLPEAPRGALAVVTRTGEFKGFFGTASKLFEMGSTYDFTEIGSGYNVPARQSWGMTQYGDRLLASNPFDGMFAYDIENIGTVDLIPGAPKARSLFVWAECVFALDCDGDNRLMLNSAPGTYANWTSGGAGNQEFPDGEALMGGGKLNDGAAGVLQRSAVHLLSLSGDAKIYNKVTVMEGVGAVNPNCIINAPGALYFWDAGGCYRLSAAGLTPIGQDRVNAAFAEGLGNDAMDFLEGAYDPERRQVCWRYKAQGVAGNVVTDNIIVFDEATGEFVEVEERTSSLIKMSAPALSMEDLDAFGSIDSLSFSLDSDVWKGGRPRLAALDDNFVFRFCEGAFLPASIDTATLINVKSSRVSSVMPITDASSCTIALGVADRLADELSWRAPSPMHPSGRAPLSGRGKVVSFRAEIPAGHPWSFIRGLDDVVVIEAAGR